MKQLISLILLISLMSCTVVDNAKYVGNWVEIIPYSSQVVQGFTLNADGTAKSINNPLLQYEQWLVDGDKLIVSGQKIGDVKATMFADTLTCISISKDSIILENIGAYRIGYFKLDEIVIPQKPVNVLDSLIKGDGLGEIISRTYQGVLPAASCPGIEYTITLHNYQHSGDGVYVATIKYLEAENGEDQVFNHNGRMYCLRGDATDKNATVYQLISFSKEDTLNFLSLGNKLELLNRNFERAESGLNYSISIIN